MISHSAKRVSQVHYHKSFPDQHSAGTISSLGWVVRFQGPEWCLKYRKRKQKTWVWSSLAGNIRVVWLVWTLEKLTGKQRLESESVQTSQIQQLIAVLFPNCKPTCSLYQRFRDYTCKAPIKIPDAFLDVSRWCLLLSHYFPSTSPEHTGPLEHRKNECCLPEVGQGKTKGDTERTWLS